MVEEMLATRGICVTYETVRQWGKKFGKAFADQIRQRAPARGDKWHMDEVVISIAGDPAGSGAPSIRTATFSTSWSNVEETRGAAAHEKASEIDDHPAPRHDHGQELRSYGAARAKKWAFKLNIASTRARTIARRTPINRPRRRRTDHEAIQKSARQAQRFLTVHDQSREPLPHPPYPDPSLLTSAVLRASNSTVWSEISRLPPLPDSRLSENRLLQAQRN